MNACELAKLWANNKWVIDDWIDDYGKRTGKSREDIVAERKAHWVHDESAESLGVHFGYEMSVIQLPSGKFGYTVVTPWDMSEGLCTIDERDDDHAWAFLLQVRARLDEATKEVENERRSSKKARAVADAAKTTKGVAKPKPETKEEPEDEPAPKRKRGRPKGSKDSKPRKRRTKAEIAADAPTQSATPKPKATPKPRRRRTKAQIIADAKRIVAEQRAERERNGLEPTEDEKRAQRRSQWLRDRPKAVRDELGRVRLGDMGMLVTNRMAWVPDGMGRYSPFPIWTDGELDYVLDDRFFVPVPESAIVAKSQEIPAKVADANRRNHYIG